MNKLKLLGELYTINLKGKKKLQSFRNYGDKNNKNKLDLQLIGEDIFFLNNKVYNYNIIKFLLCLRDNSFSTGNNLSILDFCMALNCIIPHYCYHFNLSIAGNCRMCLVELSPNIKPVAACAIPISSNIQVRTDTFLVKRAREGIMEFLLVNHPLDCPICDQGGECDLQDQSLVYGGSRGRFYHKKDFKRSVGELMCNTFIKLILTRCIHCTRCVRFLNEISGDYSIGMLGRGNFSEIGLYIKNDLATELGSNITDFCPVGALTIKQYSLETRSWEDSYLDLVDLNDSFCTPIRVFTFEGKVKRVLPKYNDMLRVAWISDITRFCLDSLDIQRYTKPQFRIPKINLVNYKSHFIKINYLKKNTFIPTSWDNISNKLCSILLYKKEKKKLNTFIGDTVDLEFNLTVKDRLALEGLKNLKNLGEVNCRNQSINCDFEQNYLNKVDNFENYNNIILLNVNLRFESAVLNAKLRQKLIWNTKFLIFFIGPKYNLTYKYLQLGTSTKLLLKILQGRHYLVNFFKNENKTLIFYNNLLLSSYNNSAILNLFKRLKNINKNIDLNFLANSASSILTFDLSSDKSIVKESEVFVNLPTFLNINFYVKCNKLFPTSFLKKITLLNNLNICFDSYNDNYFNFVSFFFPLITLMEKNSTTFFINCFGIIKTYKENFFKFKTTLKEEKVYSSLNNNEFKDDLEVVSGLFDICINRRNYKFNVINYDRIVNFIPFFELFQRRYKFYTVFNKKQYKILFFFFY